MDNFISTQTFATVAGTAGIVIIVFNTIRTVFNWGPKWFGLLLSILFSFLGLLLLSDSNSNGEELSMPIKATVAVLNGFVIFASAFSIQNTIINNMSKDKGLAPQSADGKPIFKWTTSW